MAEEGGHLSMSEFLRLVVEAFRFQANAARKTDEFTSVLSALQALPLFQRLDEGGYSEVAVEQAICLVRDKLEFIFKEGLLDFCLPQIHVKGSQANFPEPPNSSRGDKISHASVPTSEQKSAADLGPKRKENTNNPTNMDIVIHVIDDARGEKRDFACSSQLLLSAMPYFARAVKGQDLNDVDISVHCDVKIFDWLLKWMKKKDLEKDFSILEPCTAVPILLSAAFLEMETLVEECLDYCHLNLGDILDTNQSFSCVSEALMSRLVAKFTIEEVERLCERRPSTVSRLYIHLIIALNLPEFSPTRGIFRTTATLFRCQWCQNIVAGDEQWHVPCLADRVTVTPAGTLIYRHTKDNAWNLSDYVKFLKAELKSWRRVFWRLWGHCHFFYCHQCQSLYPAYQSSWCRYHPDSPSFTAVAKPRPSSLPVGKYTCCSQTAYKFAILPLFNGCKARLHSAALFGHSNNANEIDVNVLEPMLDFFRKHQHLITANPPNPFPRAIHPGFLDEQDNMGQKWGFRLVPVQRNLLSLASKSSLDSRRSAITSRQMSRETFTSATTTLADSEEMDRAAAVEGLLRDATTTSVDEVDGPDGEEGDGEEEMVEAADDAPLPEKAKNYHGRVRVKLTTRRETKPKPQATPREVDLRWNPMCTTRMNQDNQRYAEEKLMRDMIAHLAIPGLQQQGHYPGGLFRKLVLDLQDKATREARNMKLNARSAVAAAMAAAKFKAKLVDKETTG